MLPRLLSVQDDDPVVGLSIGSEGMLLNRGCNMVLLLMLLPPSESPTVGDEKCSDMGSDDDGGVGNGTPRSFSFSSIVTVLLALTLLARSWSGMGLPSQLRLCPLVRCIIDR
jgi:hypothetical protein